MNETVPVSPAKAGVMFGVLFGVIMVLEFMIAYVMDIDPVTNPTFGIIMNVLNYLILPILFVSLSCNAFKKQNAGYATFGQCLKAGVTTCLLAGLIYALFTTVFFMIFPEVIEDMLRSIRSVTLQKQPDTPAATIDGIVSFYRSFMQPQWYIPTIIVMYCFIGLIYSLIVGAIVKKEQPQSF